MAIAIIGTGALVYTLILTRESVSLAGQSAKAAKDAVEVAQDTARRELRAYVGVAGASFYDLYGLEPHAYVVIQNFGQTPARQVVVRGKMTMLPDPPEHGDYNLENYFGVTDPGHSHWVKFGFGNSLEPVMNVLRTNQQRVYVWGRIDYIDTYGDPRWRTFGLYLSHRRLDQQGPIMLSTYEGGDDAN